jgi:preprotein translocase SecE subunit
MNRPWGVLILLIYTHMETFINYLKDTFAEMKHVSWPTQQQVIVYTALVVGVSAIVAIVVSMLDFGFSHGLDWFVK